MKEINSSEPYKAFGPWSLSDFRQVSDWRKVETHLHYTFRSKLVKEVDGQKELFSVSPREAAQKLESIDSSQILKKPKIDRMFQDQEFSSYILRLFQFTGMQRLKGKSSYKLFQEFPGLKKKFWGQHIWARGYFCCSSGNVTDDVIKAYIENQNHDRDDDFRVDSEGSTPTRGEPSP